MRNWDNEQGFGLVEVLVALAIAAMSAVAIGGLLTFGVELRAREEKRADIERSILDVETLAALLGSSARTRIADVQSGSFEVASLGSAGTAGASVRIELEQDRLQILPTGGDGDTHLRPQSVIDLFAFDDHRLEYLSSGSGRLAWTAASRVGDWPIIAVRLALTERHRRWPIILWSEPQEDGL